MDAPIPFPIPPPIPADEMKDDDITTDKLSDIDSDDEAGDPEIKLSEAEKFRSTGNEWLSKGNFEEAEKSYEKGCRVLRKIKDSPFNDKKIGLNAALLANLCLANLKLQKYRECIRNSTKCIELDELNEKAIFRRGLAYKELGLFEESRSDFNKISETNASARQELASIRKLISEASKKDQEAFGGLFSSNSNVSLYEDKEKERKRFEEKKKEEEKKIYAEYIDEIDKGKTELKFDEWKKNRESDKKKEVQKPPSSASNASSSKKKIPTFTKESEEEIDLDEEERKLLERTRKEGYCYFKKDLPADHKERLKKNVPKKIETSSPSPVSAEAKKPELMSAWNAAGKTFEERDVSAPCKVSLKEFLSQVTWGGEESPRTAIWNETSVVYSAKATEVRDLQVDAQIVVVRGTKRFIFDSSFTLWTEILFSDSPDEFPKKVGLAFNVHDLTSLSGEEEWLQHMNTKIRSMEGGNIKAEQEKSIFANVCEAMKRELSQGMKVWEQNFHSCL
eukprot:GHVP01025866.1.p1 GENE.GHVP01025866.1~~GHVP01025866.1.p1  ORF type:complete len:506 (+),score=154.13 GHVP01025866.1:63-1580(+)